MNNIKNETYNKILVVEDDDDIRNFLHDALELEGYDVYDAKDGVAALKQIRSIAPNLVLLDIMMPKMNGLEVCKAVRADKDVSSTSIIFVTAKGSLEEKLEGFEAGADDFITKPFSPKELVARIEAHLRIDNLTRALETSEKKYKSLLENSPDGILLFDSNGILEFYNKSGVKIINNSKCTLCVDRRSIFEVDTDCFLCLEIKKILTRAKEKDEVTINTVVHKDDDLRVVFFEITAIPVVGSISSHNMFQVTIRNVTEQKNIEKILSKTEKINALSILTAGISHEINNPLTGISNAAQLLKRTTLAAEKKDDFIGSILANVDRISRIVEDLHLFSRRERVEAKDFDISLVIEETIKLIGYQRRDDKIKVKFENDAKNTIVKGSKNHFQQIMINLLLNACQAIEKQGSVTVRLKNGRKSEIAIINVEDTGCGIPPSQIDRIFDPFFTTKWDWNGTGLGLAVSYRLIQVLNGTITVLSEENIGTNFELVLPVVSQV